MVAKKDYYAAKHAEIDVPNLQVVKALQSLESRGYVKTQFSWQWYYYILTEEGIQYLRDFLHLPAEIVPATFKKSARPATRPSGDRTSHGVVWWGSLMVVSIFRSFASHHTRLFVSLSPCLRLSLPRITLVTLLLHLPDTLLSYPRCHRTSVVRYRP